MMTKKKLLLLKFELVLQNHPILVPLLLFHQKFLYLFKHDSKKNSVIEVVFDVVLGCGIATALNYAILPHYIDTIQSGDPLGMFSISIWYVAISFARKYAIRRWFVGMKRK